MIVRVLKHDVVILLAIVSSTHVASAVLHRADQEVVGYCTYAPNTVCYTSGWPACCVINSTETCTETQPPCDVDDIVPGYLPLITGISYCTYGPDMTCYESGWPSCCVVEGETCPDEQPGCTIALLDSGSNMPAATPPYLTDLAGTPNVMALVSEPPVAMMTDSAAASTISLIMVLCAMVLSWMFISSGV